MMCFIVGIVLVALLILYCFGDSLFSKPSKSDYLDEERKYYKKYMFTKEEIERHEKILKQQWGALYYPMKDDSSK